MTILMVILTIIPLITHTLLRPDVLSEDFSDSEFPAESFPVRLP